jgi:anti-sigma-K factor RskA
MTHTEMDELYELYALGALEPELTSEIDEHLREQCSYCLEHVSDASRLSAALAGIAEQRQPPDSLRDRVLASVAPVRRSRNWMPVVAGLAAACIALLVFSLWSGRQAASMRDQLAALRGERDQLRAALEIMGRSETRTVQFGRTEDVPHGRVFVNPRSGLVFVGAQLPQLASDRTFELWLIPRAGAPRPAGLFRPNVAGRSVNVSSIPVDASETKAVAVSVEPREGSSAPTTTPILVVPLE